MNEKFTNDDILKAAKCCVEGNSCGNCPLAKLQAKDCVEELAQYILTDKENEPAPSANGTSSEVSSSDTKKILAYLDDSTKSTVCQACAFTGRACDSILSIYESMSLKEQRAFDIGETYGYMLSARDELNRLKGGGK